MRTTIQVGDLTPEQWAWLQANLPPTREFAPDAVRMCVILFGENVGEETHVEMPPREFVALIERLSKVGVDCRCKGGDLPHDLGLRGCVHGPADCPVDEVNGMSPEEWLAVDDYEAHLKFPA